MEKRTTIYDIAARLGVSTATVNRALTGKPRVKEETRRLVIQTAEEMGFKPNALARTLARRRLRLAAVGFTSFPEFHEPFLQGVRTAGEELADFNMSLDCFEYTEGANDNPEAVAFLENTLIHIADEGYDGVLVLGRPVEAFEYLCSKGVCVATVVNDIEDQSLRRFNVCYKARVAGSMAAELISRMMPDRTRPVAIASGYSELVVHKEVERGFREQIRTMPLDLVRVDYNHDNESIAYESTARLLDEVPQLGAIYINTFNYRGVIRAVREAGRAGRILIVASDICEEMRQLIREGTVVASIFQNQYEQGRLGVHRMYSLLADGAPVEDVIAINPQIVMRSNLTLF